MTVPLVLISVLHKFLIHEFMKHGQIFISFSRFSLSIPAVFPSFPPLRLNKKGKNTCLMEICGSVLS